MILRVYVENLGLVWRLSTLEVHFAWIWYLRSFRGVALSVW